MTLAEAIAKIEQHKEQLKQPKQDYQPQPTQTRNQARAQYNFMRGMPQGEQKCTPTRATALTTNS